MTWNKTEIVTDKVVDGKDQGSAAEMAAVRCLRGEGFENTHTAEKEIRDTQKGKCAVSKA